jgi:hypothetical protein
MSGRSGDTSLRGSSRKWQEETSWSFGGARQTCASSSLGAKARQMFHLAPGFIQVRVLSLETDGRQVHRGLLGR